MESKVKSKKSKKGAGGGGLPAAIDLEIREAEQYLATDVQVRMTLRASRITLAGIGDGFLVRRSDGFAGFIIAAVILFG
jgi:hypothetical protein